MYVAKAGERSCCANHLIFRSRLSPTAKSTRLVLYLIYYPSYKIVAERARPHVRHLFSFLPAPTEEWALSLIIANVVAIHLAICTVVTIALLAFVGGPENRWTSAWATFLGITSVILATIQYVPQIHRTFRRKVCHHVNVEKEVIYCDYGVL